MCSLFEFEQVPHNRWIQCLADLKACKQSNIPVYSFAEHQRLEEKRYLYGATIIIGMCFQLLSMSGDLWALAEGIMALHDSAFRSLYDLKAC